MVSGEGVIVFSVLSPSVRASEVSGFGVGNTVVTVPFWQDTEKSIAEADSDGTFPGG